MALFTSFSQLFLDILFLVLVVNFLFGGISVLSSKYY